LSSPALRFKLAFPLLVLGSVTIWNAQVFAQTPTTPPPSTQPASSNPAQQQSTDPVGSVATLQGSAFVTHNNAATAIHLSDSIYKGDVLRTGPNGTMGITFDDDTTFTLKPNSQIAVDDFVYQQGGSNNAATFNVLQGTAAFVAEEVAHTGNMKIDTPTSTLGIRGTTGLVEVPENGSANAASGVSIKLYPDADGRVGRIEVFGRDGGQLGVLNRAASGFAVRAGAPGAPQRFAAVPLQISPQEADRDRAFTRQAFSSQLVGRQINIQRRTLQQQRNQLRPNQPRPNNLQRPNNLERPNNLQRPNQLPGREQRPQLQHPPGQQGVPGAHPALQHAPGAPPKAQRAPPRASSGKKQNH
jgi:FecR-like protein